MFYLASPYTHKYAEMMQVRYEFTLDIVAYLIRKKIPVFSPIAHFHVIAMQYDLPKDYEFWKYNDEAAIRACSGFMIAAIEGWKQSKGIRKEYEFAVREGKQISMITPTDTEGYIIDTALSINPFSKEVKNESRRYK